MCDKLQFKTFYKNVNEVFFYTNFKHPENVPSLTYIEHEAQYHLNTNRKKRIFLLFILSTCTHVVPSETCSTLDN